MTALFVGDISWDTTAVVDRIPERDEKLLTGPLTEDVGGVVTNAAIACTLAGAPVVLVCPVPDDPAGAAAAAALAARGVTVLPQAGAGPTCRSIVLLDRSGEKRLVLAPGDSMYPSASTVAGLSLDVDWVHTALYDHVAGALLLTRCAEAGVRCSVDLEPATLPADLASLATLLRGCHTVFLNARAAALLGPGAPARLLALGITEVVETLGGQGARLWTGAGEVPVPVPPDGPPVRDTTGAGDALAGWFVAERLAGAPAPDALRTAVAAASLSVGTVGAAASYPVRTPR